MHRLAYVLHPHQHGWRWAVYLATQPQFEAEPLRRCVNAGFSTDRDQADLDGQTVLYSLMNFVALTRRHHQLVVLELDHDPLPVVGLQAVQVSSDIVQIGET